MKSYLIHKNHIEGFKDVSATAKTVEKIAAASTHFLKLEVNNLNSYTIEIEKVLTRLSLFYQKKEHPLLKKRKSGKKMIVILTGNKGLVGGLWHKVITLYLENRKQYQSLVVVGAKGKNYLEEEIIPITKSFDGLSEIPLQEEIKNISGYIFNEFKKGTVSKVDVLYLRFVSLAQQQAEIISLLPFEFDLKRDRTFPEGIPIFEPSKKEIFGNLLQKYIKVFFHKIIFETKLSELSSRTVAMEHASVKTDEFIRKSTLDYLKERRWLTTQKQLESFTAHKTL